tara:strand:- start:884 stop:1216 length:333 start_codon:yes stop_codon:yes gene_type:complete
MAARADIIIDQGTTFSTVVTVTDDNGNVVDLTNYEAASQIRKHHTSSAVTSTFVITNGGTNGQLTLELAWSATASMAAGRYVYDVEVTTAAGVVSRVVEGIVTVNPQVTR